MNHPLQANYYADRCVHQVAPVLLKESLARDTYLVRLQCPAIASQITPGQFVMIRAPHRDDPLLGRAFAMYDVQETPSQGPHAVDIVFHVIGKMTRLLSQVSHGDELEVWGPLGNGFAPQSVDHLVLVAGGIGQTPFMALAKEYLARGRYGQDRPAVTADRVTLCYGARTAAYLAGVADFENLGVEVTIATDDGSRGHAGLVTELLPEVIGVSTSSVRIECCGPERMMQAVSDFARERDVSCRVSLETPMACGLGICFSCVTRVRLEDGSWDYKRTCVDGPVFMAENIVW